jgi:NET1-associated nuclear protein 1 (U3 small nucleolar RNA-associated protein 17)
VDRHSFVAVGASVKIYSVATAQLLSTLSIPNLSTQTSDGSLRRTKVSCLLLNPANSLQLIVGSLDGMLRLWDYKEGKLIRTLDLGSPIQLACSHPAILDQIFVAIVSSDETVEGVIEGRKKNSSSESVEMAGIYAISLKPKALATGSTASASTPRSPARRMRLAKPRVVTALGISSSGTFLIAVNPRQINLCYLKQIQRGFASRIESKDNLTCLAFHPTENYFATGNDKGQIRLWYGVLEEGNAWEAAIKLGTSKSQSGPGSTSVFHWHAHAVTALAFTPNGAYLMSGGEEAVLVLWQLHTGHQEFVPRLGSPILTLSINDSPEQEQQVAARLRDGTVVFIGSQKLKVSKTISGIKAGSL